MVDSGVPRHVLAAGVVLWGLVFVLAGVLVLPAIMSTISGVATAGDTTGDDGTVVQENETNVSPVEVQPSENVSLAVDNDSGIDLVVDLGSFETSVATGGTSDDGATVTMESRAIDDGVERDGDAGLCVVGFDSRAAPLTIDLDGTAGTVNATMTASAAAAERTPRTDPQSIVEECRTH